MLFLFTRLDPTSKEGLAIEFELEHRGWQCKVMMGDSESGQWEVSINGVHQSEMEKAPQNERVLEEIHKSETFPNYSDIKL